MTLTMGLCGSQWYFRQGKRAFLFFLMFGLSTQGMLGWLKVDDLVTHKDGRSLSGVINDFVTKVARSDLTVLGLIMSSHDYLRRF